MCDVAAGMLKAERVRRECVIAVPPASMILSLKHLFILGKNMSKLAEFRQLEQHLAEQLKALEALKGDAGLQKEIEFETKLRTLLGEYDKSLSDAVSILDPKTLTKTAPISQKPARRARAVKVYNNPHNGEVVETKGGNHKTLKQWKGEYGSDVVESWVS
jgi:hypothetical protein